MARFNEILVGRYNNALRKMFGMKGAAPAPQAGGEFMPVMPFFYGAENRFLEQWDQFSWTAGVLAVAAQNAVFRLRNPIGSNVIAVVVKALCFGSVADAPALQQGAINADFTTAAMSSVRLDNRGRPSPTLIFSTSDAVNPPVSLPVRMQASFPANGSIDYILYEGMEMPLLPGDAIQFQSNVVNQALHGCFMWRERALEESERQ